MWLHFRATDKNTKKAIFPVLSLNLFLVIFVYEEYEADKQEDDIDKQIDEELAKVNAEFFETDETFVFNPTVEKTTFERKSDLKLVGGADEGSSEESSSAPTVDEDHPLEDEILEVKK